MNTELSKTEFMVVAESLFLRKGITAECIYNALVPTGTINSAVPGTFGSNGIYKFVFRSSDGYRIIVKYHKPDVNAKGGIFCNSRNHCTAQIQVGHKLLSLDAESNMVTWTRKPSNNTHIIIADFGEVGASVGICTEECGIEISCVFFFE